MRAMKLYVGGLFLVALVGCDQPGPIEVVHETAREPYHVTYLLGKPNDSLVVTYDAETNYELTGILKTEEEVYPATMVVNGVESDITGSHQSTSLSRVVLRDVSSPESVSGNFGQFIKYQHLNIGSVRLNGTELDREEVILQVRSRTTLIIPNGVLYKLVNDDQSQNKPFVFHPNIDYAIAAEGKAQISGFIERIDSPDAIELIHPKPYSLVFGDEDLTLRWSGRSGSVVHAVVSFYDEANQRVGRPIMELRATARTNAMLVPAKLLNLIPRTSSGKYVITLISANREETTVPGYSGTVLVQSASIHNAAVTIK